MKNFLKKLAIIIGIATFFPLTAFALIPLPVNQGGTGVNTITGILRGNGTAPFSTATSGDIISTLGFTPISTVNVDGVTITGNGVGIPLVAHSGSGSSSLNANEIAFGDPSNVMTSSPNLSYNPSVSDFAVGFGGTSKLHLNELTGDYSLGNTGGAHVQVLDAGATSVTNDANFVYAQNGAGNRYQLLGGGFYNTGDLSCVNNCSQTTINDAARTFTYSDKPHGFGTSRYIYVDPRNPDFSFGDIDNTQFGDYLNIGKNRFTFYGKPGSDRYLNFNAGGEYSIGDLDGAFQGTTFTVDDSSQGIIPRADQYFSYRDTSDNSYIEADPQTGFYGIGDLDNVHGKSSLLLDDSIPNLKYQVGGQNYLYLDPSTAQYQIGSIGGTYINIDDSSSVTTLQQNAALISQNTSGQQFLNLDPSISTYKFGDLSSIGNSTNISVEDGSTLIRNTTAGQFIVQSPLTGVSTLNVDNGSNQVTISQAYTLDNTVGTPGYVLTTDGSSAATWQPVPGFSIGAPVTGGTPNDVLYTDSSGNAAQCNNFLFNPDPGTHVFSVGAECSGSDKNLILDQQFGTYSMGSLPGNVSGFGTHFDVVDGSQHFDTYSNTFTANQIGTGLTYMYADYQPGGNIDMRLGDSGFHDNGTQFQIEDALSTIQANTGTFKVADPSSTVHFTVDGASGVPTINVGAGQYSLPPSAGSPGQILTMGFGGVTGFAPAPTTSVGIGTAITSSTPWEVLYTDASGNLAQDTGLIFNPTVSGTDPFGFHVSLNSTNVFDLSMLTGVSKLGNYSGGGVGPVYFTQDWGTTGNATLTLNKKFFVSNGSGVETFDVNTASNTVKISNRYTLPTSTGTAGQVVTSDGVGGSSWTTISSGTSTSLTFTGDVTGSGTSTIPLTIATNAVTFAKFQQIASSTLLGNPTGSTANATTVNLGTCLSYSGTTLNACATPTVTSTQIAYGNASNAITSDSLFTRTSTTTNISYATNGTALNLNDTTKTAVLAGNLLSLRDGTGHHYFDLNSASSTLTMGDISGTGAGNQFTIDMLNNINTQFTVSFRVRWSGANYLNIDDNAALYQMGDIGGTNNHTFFQMNDTTQQILFATGGANLVLMTSTTTQVSNNLTIAGSESLRTDLFTTSATLDKTNTVARCDATAGAVTITLPTAASAYNSTLRTGDHYYIKKVNASVNNCTIQAAGAELIDGSNTQSLTGLLRPDIEIISNGTGWDIL